MSEDIIPPTDLDRLLSSFRKLVRAEFPTSTFRGIFEYAVEAVGSNTIDCSPTDTQIPLPSLAKVPLRSSILGAIVTPTVGSRCLIMFVNTDITQPVCVFIEGPPAVATVRATGAVNLASGGYPTTEHVMTVEATVLLVYNMVNALGVALAAVSPPVGITDTATLGSALSSPALATQWVIALNAAIANQSIPPPGVALAPALNTSSAFAAAIAAGLSGKLPDATALYPGIGSPLTKTG